MNRNDPTRREPARLHTRDGEGIQHEQPAVADERATTDELKALVAQLRAKADERGDAFKASGIDREAFGKINDRIDTLELELREAAKARRSGRSDDTSTQDMTEKAQALARSAVIAYIRRGEQRLTADQRDALEKQERALSVDSDPNGGYVVTPEQSARISTIVYETSPMRSVATVETISTDALEGLYDGDEAEAGWVGERQARPETDTPQLGKWRIPVHEIYAAPRATQKLLDDAYIDIEAWLARKVSERFSRMENTAFVLGDGVGKPRGFLTYPDGTGTAPRGVIEQIPSLAAAGVAPEAIWNLVYGIKNAYRQGATWAMNRATIGAIRTIREGAGTGQFMWAPGFGGTPSQLAGYPIAEFEDMPDATSGEVAAAFGNFRTAYTIVDRIGIRVLRDPYTAKPYVEFYTTKRVGGDVINYEAIKLMDIAAS